MLFKGKALGKRRPVSVFAIFAAAFILQGIALAVFSGDRPAVDAPRKDPARSKMTGPVAVTAIYTVTSPDDGGPGSLPQAILDANNSPGLDEIRFDFSNPVTLTMSASLLITDPVSIVGPGPYITAPTGFVTVDGTNVGGDLFVISNTTGTSIQNLRLNNVINGFGFQIIGGPGGTMIISNTVENSMGGVMVQNTSGITLTHNIFMKLGLPGVQAEQTQGLWMQHNMIQDVGGAGVSLLDGISNALIVSNTINGVSGLRAAIGIALIGNSPAPTGVVMRDNIISDTGTPIFLGPGANNDFPAPEIGQAFAPITETLEFSLRSPADPVSYTYPLLMDIYRVRDGDYLPLGSNVMYDASAFPDFFTYTAPIPPSAVLPSDFLVVIATTFNPSSSEFSEPAALEEELPVELAAFDALIEGDRALLTWTTASETNNAGFEIQHGFEQRGQTRWDVIGFVDGSGTTDEPKSYHFEIGDLEPGRHRFRLKQIDFDGTFEFSSAIEAVVKVPGSHSLSDAYPNPFNPKSYFSVAVPTEQSVTVSLHDVSGRLVQILFEGNLPADEQHWITIDGSGLASGLYLYRLVGESFSESKTVTLQK